MVPFTLTIAAQVPLCDGVPGFNWMLPSVAVPYASAFKTIPTILLTVEAACAKANKTSVPPVTIVCAVPNVVVQCPDTKATLPLTMELSLGAAVVVYPNPIYSTSIYTGTVPLVLTIAHHVPSNEDDPARMVIAPSVAVVSSILSFTPTIPSKVLLA